MALASKGQQEQRRRKKDLSKIKCFQCGEKGHYATQCPLKKREKDEKPELWVASTKIDEEESAMIAHIPPGGRWADLEM